MNNGSGLSGSGGKAVPLPTPAPWWGQPCNQEAALLAALGRAARGSGSSWPQGTEQEGLLWF